MDIFRSTSDSPDFLNLVAELDKILAELDGDDHAFYAQFNKTDQLKNVVVAYDGMETTGCGAFRPYDSETVEIKRMYVEPEHRGKRIAQAMLKDLERWAKKLGYSRCILETGNKQVEAIRLYQKAGYEVMPNYGQYENVANSICMQKRIK